MAVQTRKDSRSGERKLYIGAAPVKVVAINPTMAELNELGVMFTTEPDYNSKDKFRVDVWTHHETAGYNKISFWPSMDMETSTTGKKRFIDKYGKTSFYCNSLDEANYIDKPSARELYRGEEFLTRFIKPLGNVDIGSKEKPGGECRLEHWEDLCDGNLDELTEIWKANPEITVKVLFGVRLGQYQDIYPKAFDYGKSRQLYSISKVVPKDNNMKSYCGVTPWAFQEYNAEMENHIQVYTTSTIKEGLPF